MLKKLGLLTVKYRWPVLVMAGAVFVIVGAYGGDAPERLSSGGFSSPQAEATLAEEALQHDLGTGSPNLVLVVTAEGGDVDSPNISAAATKLTDELAAEPGLSQVGSYWTLNRVPVLKSRQGDSALIIGRISGDQNAVVSRGAEMHEKYGGPIDGGEVKVGGYASTFAEIQDTIERDLLRAEMIAIPLTIVLLLLIFRGVVAALLPLVIGALSVVGTLAVLKILASVTEVSIFALNLTTAMGLGLAIDYSLFMVSRFREELASGHEPNRAVVRTIQTAGRTVIFSALTVAASLLSLLVFPLSFLRSFAYAGVAVSLLAGFFSTVVLSAILALLGPRIDLLSVRHKAVKEAGSGFWYRAAKRVMGRPVITIVGISGLLLFLGSPFLNIEFGIPDDRVLPPSAESRSANDTLRNDFDSNEVGALAVVLPEAKVDLDDGDLRRYAAALSRIGGVARVDARTGVYIDGTEVLVDSAITARFVGSNGGTWLSVVPSIESMSKAGEKLVTEVRATPAPTRVLVTGETARLLDTREALFARLPLAGALIAAVTFTILFLMFGSVLVPIKALVLNMLSLSAVFGAMVWIFQEGHFADALAFTPTGAIDLTTPILMFCVAFGLSMDYEVFLLSRIKEEHDRGRENIEAVAVGLDRTGRIVTAAAALMAVVFLAFGTSDVTFIKLFGFGLTVAVLIDAFIIRATLVPALMRLAGEVNWWAPRPLRAIYARFGISETVDVDG